MDFNFDESQKMLSTAARDFLTRECPKKHVRDMENDEKGYSPDLWRKMAEMGWMGLVVPEAYYGMGQSYLDLAVLLEEMGRALVPGPFFSTVALGALIILESGSEEQKKRLLPRVGEGKLILTAALAEADGRCTAESVKTEAKTGGDGYVLTGTKLFVPDAIVADYIICPARTGEGITLFLVDRKAAGVTCTVLKTMSHDKQCEVVLNKVKVSNKDVLGKPGLGWKYIENVMPHILMAKCAEMVGMSQQILDMTVDYAKQRIQFGKPIGTFQAVQHYCATMAINLEGARYITYDVAWRLSEKLPSAKEASIAKAYLSDAIQQIVLLGHAVHGSIGFSIDHDLPLYYTRAKAAELALGDAYFHQELVSRQKLYDLPEVLK